MQRSAKFAASALGVALRGDLRCLRVRLQHRAQFGAAQVQPVDSVEVEPHQLRRAEPPGGHPRLHLGDGRLGQCRTLDRFARRHFRPLSLSARYRSLIGTPFLETPRP